MSPGHVGPHVPCTLRAFFVLSVIAIPIGIGTIVGGVLIIISVDGQATVAAGAVVIFTGLCIAIFPPVLSYKVFDLRLKMFEGRPRIAKNYGGFPDSLRRPDFSDVTGNSYSFVRKDTDASLWTPVRAAYLPDDRVKGNETDHQEEITSFSVGSSQRNVPEERITYHVVGAASMHRSGETETTQHGSTSKPRMTKPVRRKEEHGTAGVYTVSGPGSSVTVLTDGQATIAQGRNISFLHPASSRGKPVESNRTRF